MLSRTTRILKDLCSSTTTSHHLIAPRFTVARHVSGLCNSDFRTQFFKTKFSKSIFLCERERGIRHPQSQAAGTLFGFFPDTSARPHASHKLTAIKLIPFLTTKLNGRRELARAAPWATWPVTPNGAPLRARYSAAAPSRVDRGVPLVLLSRVAMG